MVETNKKVGQVFFFSGPVATWARGAATREQCLRGREAQGPGIKKRRTIRGSALVFRGSPFNPEKPRHLRCLQIPRYDYPRVLDSTRRQKYPGLPLGTGYACTTFLGTLIGYPRVLSGYPMVLSGYQKRYSPGTQVSIRVLEYSKYSNLPVAFLRVLEYRV